jgi:hypothetical protein
MDPDADPEAWDRALTRYDGKPWPDMDFGDVVEVNDKGPEEIRGERGYILGWAPESDPPEVGVFVYTQSRVWQLDYPMVSPTGEKHRARRF